MLKVVIGVGLPGSGKTTALKPFAEKNGYIYISPDEIREELYGNASIQRGMTEVWDMVHARAQEALHANKSIVVDATFAHANERRNFIAFCKNSGAEKVQGVFAVVPLELSDKRNQARERTVPRYAMERMYRDLSNEKPVVEDGFDAVFDINEFQELERIERQVVQVKHFGEIKMR
jgi:predicted kinase